MFFRKKEPKPQPVPNPAFRDFVGSEIWGILEAGLFYYGLKMRRNGTAQLTHDKWGDGKWHFRCEADEIEPENTGIGLFVDDVPYPKASWNALSVEERRAMVQNHVVQFKMKGDEDVDQLAQ